MLYFSTLETYRSLLLVGITLPHFRWLVIGIDIRWDFNVVAIIASTMTATIAGHFCSLSIFATATAFVRFMVFMVA